MKTSNILKVTSSGRYEASLTRQVANLVVEALRGDKQGGECVDRNVALGLPFVHEAWINANFTASDDRTDEQNEVLDLSNQLVAELVNADHIVIASPIYNFSVPAVLKAWVDLIARAGLTFQYTEKGPVGLLKNKKATIVMASGGVPVESEMDMATAYLKLVLGFIGITDVKVIDAGKIDLLTDNDMQSAKDQIAALLIKQ